MQQKTQSSDICLVTHIWSATDIIFCHLRPFFALLRYYWHKKMQKTPGDIILLHICTINQDHDVRFLRYKVQRTKFFVIMGHFLSFDPPNNPKNQNFEKTVIWCMVPEISSTTDIIFSHFGLFFAILPPPPLSLKTQKIKILKKWKKLLEILSYHFTQVP